MLFHLPPFSLLPGCRFSDCLSKCMLYIHVCVCVYVASWGWEVHKSTNLSASLLPQSPDGLNPQLGITASLSFIGIPSIFALLYILSSLHVRNCPLTHMGASYKKLVHHTKIGILTTNLISHFNVLSSDRLSCAWCLYVQKGCEILALNGFCYDKQCVT